MKTIKIICVLALLASTSACVTGTREINLETPNSTSSVSKDGLIYIASIEDKREFEQKPRKPEIPSVKGKLESKTATELSTYIGRQRNGYGGAMGSVSLNEGSTVQSEVKKLISNELVARGYTISDTPENAKSLDIDIEKFWAWMVPGFISIGFESELLLKLESQGSSSSVHGKGNNEGQVASNANWALTYKRAYADLLSKLAVALDEIGL